MSGNGEDSMLDRMKANKLVIAGVVAALVAAGGWGYYTYAGKKATAPPAGNAAQSAAGHAGHGAGGEVVTLDAKARQLAGVQTATVAKKALAKDVKTTGKIALNENSRTYITSRVEGRIDELYITAEGQYIAPGQPIAAVYSPTYISAQEEYLLALDSVQKLRGASREVVQLNNKLLEAARRKMILLGIPEGDIEHLSHTRKANNTMIIRAQFGGTVMEKAMLPGAYIMPGDKLFTLSDLSSVWLYADIYEKDIAAVSVGQEVQVTSNAYPGQTFAGVVTFINPVVDDATRAVKVRIEMPNPDGKLKPNMFVSAAVRLPLGESLAIPVSSLLDTGARKVVYVAQGEDSFVKRDITTGQEADGYIQVLSGLQPGEVVVTAAAFLIDSQTQLGSFGSHAGHGGSKPAASAPAAQPQAAPAAKPAQPSEHSGH
jgi:Cu(I)/Ag(I) efflux system membrane fusion protein